MVRTEMLTGLLAVAIAVPLHHAGAQQIPDTRRSQATRAELEATLVEIDRIVQSPGYSSRLRNVKSREATMIRERLEHGDLRVGDQLVLYVEGQQELTDTFSVQAGRVLALPNLPEVPVGGILRSEAQAHLTRELGKYIRNPTVRVLPMIRLSFLGLVGQPGFHQLPAEMLVSEAIMAAGGPVDRADPNRSEVRRLGQVLVTREEFRNVLVEGVTLDQLNLRAGDEIIIDAQRSTGIQWQAVLGAVSVVTSLAYLATRIF